MKWNWKDLLIMVGLAFAISAIIIFFVVPQGDSGAADGREIAEGIDDVEVSEGGQASTSPVGDRISVVCTMFPQYDWVRQILGENDDGVELTLLADSGIDLHNFQPTVEDMVKISESDVFIYTGGESDEWVEEVLSDVKNSRQVRISLLEVLGDRAKTEEIVAGMEEEHSEEHEAEEHEAEEHEAEEGHVHSGEVVYDEHVWLSLRNAKVFCGVIAGVLTDLSSENADAYQANLDEYVKELSGLDIAYKSMSDLADVKTLVFGDRFPFRYLVDDYGLDYFAAFPGCSAETEASFETVVFLAEKVDELGLKNVMALETSNRELAETVIANTQAKNQNIILLDSMQSVTRANIQEGTTYLSVMQKNLTVLEQVLK